MPPKYIFMGNECPVYEILEVISWHYFCIICSDFSFEITNVNSIKNQKNSQVILHLNDAGFRNVCTHPQHLTHYCWYSATCLQDVPIHSNVMSITVCVCDSLSVSGVWYKWDFGDQIFLNPWIQHILISITTITDFFYTFILALKLEWQLRSSHDRFWWL